MFQCAPGANFPPKTLTITQDMSDVHKFRRENQAYLYGLTVATWVVLCSWQSLECNLAETVMAANKELAEMTYYESIER